MADTAYYSPGLLKVLKEQLKDSEALHKMMNPMCGACLAERGREILENGWSWERQGELRG
jgi:hypothetical protein